MEIGEGGAERVLTELMEEWSKKGHNVTLIQTMPGLYGRSYSVIEGIDNIDIHSNKKSKIGRYFEETVALLKYLRTKPDSTVVAFANASIRIVGVCSFFTPNRIVFSERCDPRFTPSSKKMRWLRDLLFGIADVCVFQTKDAKELFPIKAQKNGVVIPNPINPHLPPVYSGERRKVIITASRLVPQKNLPMLINAFSKLVKEHPDYSLEIYGTGSEEKKLQELIKQLELYDCVKLMGHTSDIHDIMRKCSMYVCASNYEGMSNSILEALALGLPVVSTDHPIGGAREMINDKVNGLLVPVNNTDALYKAMKYLIENPDFAKYLGDNGSEIRDYWPVELIADRWIELF